jgi:hypothetical protein
MFVSEKLAERGFTSPPHAPCIYSGVYDGQPCLILRQVDDLNVATTEKDTAIKLYNELHKEFALVQEASHVMRMYGVNVEQTCNYIKLHLTEYINGMVKQYEWMQGISPDAYSTPLPRTWVRNSMKSVHYPLNHNVENLKNNMGSSFESSWENSFLPWFVDALIFHAS